MTADEIRYLRLQLGLTIEEFAWALEVPEDEMLRIEAGQSKAHLTPEFAEALDRLNERLFGTYVGA